MYDASDAYLQQASKAGSAGRAGDVSGCATQIAAGEYDGVIFGVDHPVIFGRPFERDHLVWQSRNRTVVSGTDDAMVAIH